MKSIKIWSAGCSTGEEPYSIAITLKDYFVHLEGYDLHILGTDVSVKALKKAMSGVYTKNSFRITDPDILKRYFIQVSDTKWAIVPEIKNLVTFSYHNLIKEPYPLALFELWDVIFCRNVVIYFKPESTKRVIENFYKSLKPGGFLFTGHTETLYHMNPGFEIVRFGDAFIFKKPEESHRGKMIAARIPQKKKADVKKVSNQKSAEIKNKKTENLDASEIVRELTHMVCEAEEKEDEVKKYTKEDCETMKKLAVSLLDRSDVNGALDILENLVEREEGNSELRYLYGIALRRLERLDEAESEFQKAVYLDHDNYLALMELGNMKLFKNELKEALKYFILAADSIKKSKCSGEDSEKELLLQICEMTISDLKGKGV